MNTRLLEPLAGLLLALLLAGCAAAPPLRPAPPPPFADALFKPPATPVDVSQLFAMSPAMQRYADDVLRPAMRFGSSERALIEALYEDGQLKLEYDAERTRTAASAFEARAGNCLSLVMMTGAFARYFDMPFRYQEVFTTPSWSRSGKLAFSNRHVNLSLTMQSSDTRITVGERGENASLTVDFMPPTQATQRRSRTISEKIITAMYLNNRAAELLADGKLDEAYWWARKAIESVPDYTDSYNTLGIIYQQHGDLAKAEDVLLHALALEPENTIPMSNLAGLLKVRGKAAEAAKLEQKLAQLEPYPPFHFYDQGMVALKAGDFETARQLFQREVNREAYQADANFWLGVAEMYLGDHKSAKRHLSKAVDHSTTSSNRAVYSAKLDWLKSQGYEDSRRKRAAATGS